MDGDATIRLPGGDESTFSLARTDLVLPRGGLQIVGTGPAPF